VTKAISLLMTSMLVLVVQPATGPATGPAIIDRLMPQTHSSPRPEGAAVDTIMLHFSSDVIARPDDPFDVDRVIDIYTKYNASAHYLIDRQGNVYRLVDEQRSAWHAGKGELPFEPRRKDVLNRHSIGIEMLGIGSWRDMRIFMSKEKYDRLRQQHPGHVGFTDAQYAALDALIEDIVGRWPEIRRDRYHVVGHEEYAPGRRTDPGDTFDWTRIGLTRERPPR
jgi:N-acetyl-anhydromuramyl-L-alanine amidase AmpD